MELKKKWIYFVNRKEWTPTSNSVICVEHFESKYVKYGKRCTLKWELHPIPTIHTDSISSPSLLRIQVVSRRSPRKRKQDIDQLKEFQEKDKVESFETFSQDHAPSEFTLKRLQESLQYYGLIFDSKSGFPRVYEYISIGKELHVKLTFQGFSIPLPDWFRIGHNCTVNRFSMLKNFFSHIKNRSDSFSSILSELNSMQHYKPQGRPKFSSSMIRYALLLRYTSWQSYKLLLQQFSLPSLSLSKKITSGFIDSVKAAKLFLEKGAMSENCALLVDEMYLKNSVQFHRGNFTG